MTQTVTNGSLLLAALIAAAAGVMAFASPCVLPLVPSYLGFVASGVRAGGRRAAMVWGVLTFIAGFSAVFLSYGALFGTAGRMLSAHRTLVERILGSLVVLLGIAFMGGISWLQFDRRPHRWSATGVTGGLVLGVAFGLGWSPCIGPALAAVQALAFSQATAARGTVLSAAFCAGLGVPFLALAVLGQRLAGGIGLIRRHIRVINIVGGAMLMLLGVLLLTGWWASVLAWLQSHAPQWTPPW